MASNYLAKLSSNDREKLIKDLWDIQGQKCFITEDLIDLDLHYTLLDIDHVMPSKLGGKDDPSNFALTFASANRSKQASDLKLARLLHRFKKIQDDLKEKEDRSPNLDDILKTKLGSKFSLKFRREDDFIVYSLAQIGKTELVKTPIHKSVLMIAASQLPLASVKKSFTVG